MDYWWELLPIFGQTYSSIVGFFVGAVIYYVFAKYWWFKKYPQAEIVDPDDAKYLGITAGRDWMIDGARDGCRSDLWRARGGGDRASHPSKNIE